jgi:hypothetical protein
MVGLSVIRASSTLANSATQLEDLSAQFVSTKDEAKRAHISTTISYYEGLVETLPLLKVRLPNLTLDDRLSIYGSERTAHLIAFKEGHSLSDSILYLPAEGIIFMGDLLFIDFHPYLADGDPILIVDFERSRRIRRPVFHTRSRPDRFKEGYFTGARIHSALSANNEVFDRRGPDGKGSPISFSTAGIFGLAFSPILHGKLAALLSKIRQCSKVSF